MTLRKRIIACLLTCTVVAATAGCTTMRPFPVATDPAAPAFAGVKVGETVDVETRAGRRIRIVVREVEREAIVSADGERYTRAEVVELKRRSFRNAKTGWLAAGLLYILAMAVGAAIS